MILFLVFIAVIQLFINIIFKNSKSAALCCGLAGFYPKKNKKVNLEKLFMLGVMNEERGTDSTGLSIGNVRFCGTGLDKKCRDFVNKYRNDIYKENLLNKPCILHTRKSTIGSHTEENCHPFVIEYKKDDNYYFSLAHNGVINNTKDIKEKFLSDVSDIDKHLKIDSHYLLFSLYNSFRGNCNEEDILKFYNGNAALLYYDSNGVFKAWKGGNNNVEERPLYYVETKEGWYFCSLENSLEFVFGDKYVIYSLSNNELLTFYNYDLQSYKIIERNIKSEKVVAYSAYNKYDYNYDYNMYDYNKKVNTEKSVIKSEVIQNSNNAPLYHPVISYINGLYIDRHSKNLINGEYKVASSSYSKQKLYSLFSNKSTHKESVNFVNGVLVRDKKIYASILSRFRVDIYPTIDKFFEGEYNKIKNTIVDLLPLFDDKGLYLVLYKDENYGLNYISRNDVDTVLVNTKFSSSNIRIYADGNKMILENVNSYY